MSNDFFDQDTGNGMDDGDMSMNENVEGASILINGSRQAVEAGASFLNTCKSMARHGGLGKFKVWLNGVEVKPSNAPAQIESDMNVEIRPYDEAGC